MEILNWKEILLPYEQAVEELKVKFACIAEEFRKLGQYCPIESVDGRVKKISSIIDKANKKGLAMSDIKRSIEDIAGVRIICQFVEDIYKVVAMIKARDNNDMYIISERDYITKTKPSGYRSYHIIIRYPLHTASGRKDVLAEIQIRTMAMNFWATIEHSLKYKYSGNIPIALQERLIGCAEAAFTLDTEMATIRNEILEAQKIFQLKSDLVAEILDNIKKLHYVAKLSEMDEINKKFFDLYEEDSIDKLDKFNEQLSIMIELYRVEVG